MTHSQSIQDETPAENSKRSRRTRPLRTRSHRIYFSRQAERRFFFYLTAAMLLAGLIYRFI